ncbi:MAG: ribose 5-phosphate isomerase B, partial [Pseudomonadota bacterium]
MVVIGSDHRGYRLKEALKAVLKDLGKTVEDAGAFSEATADYPEFAKKVAQKVSCRDCDRGILICGSGIGMSITANKFPGVRAALCHDVNTARMCRLHNDANILVFGEAVGLVLAEKMVKIWFETPFEAGRHQKRLDFI